MKYKDKKVFSEKIIDWYLSIERRSLPWNQDKSIYKVWVSEIMLQRTRASSVIPYFNRFIRRFPDVQSIADSSVDEVLYYWSGLGYYARARNMYKTAKEIVRRFNGTFPTNFKQINTFPGIGRSTAGAILSISKDLPFPVLDSNVKRVLIRFLGLQDVPTRESEDKLWCTVSNLVPKTNSGKFNQAMMELGSEICLPLKKPICNRCPLVDECISSYSNNSSKKLSPSLSKKNKFKNRNIWFLILRRMNLFFLKRVSYGRLWKGLYIFPKFSSIDLLKQFLMEKKLYDSVNEIIELNAISHCFSNVRLKIFPIQLDIKNLEGFSNFMEDDEIWYDGSHQKIGIPKPVHLLMRQIGHF
ncbi:A/G-specific adenine glycosylase [Candidatus Riesia pediculischaeffi]|uniref:Adenine DNA glycosylase n=1 Tax=Candidatus Riesia pediculischaeffi PTSU TaxID=1401651 RepID=A0A0C1V8Z4_9ENTR|nr:A/G-specific adenine glycosylase [Candidatus Riesia pediculischaeffi]KIE64283.1 A/G-specific adenine glycosylase [Candidatus Riesia pediculischaeffi PTSU]